VASKVVGRVIIARVSPHDTTPITLSSHFHYPSPKQI
jgi:hypothetical protein